MVERRTLSATVVDLDGTLVGRNTLVEFAKFVFGEGFRRGRFGTSLAVGFWVTVRQLRLISHRRMKFHIVRWGERLLTAADVGRFADAVSGWANIDVVDRMTDEMTVLATSAPRLYAEAVAARFGIAHVVATESVPRLADFVECKAEEKRRRVDLLLRDANAELVAVITDHHDDIPLLQANPTGRNILVGPSRRTLRRLAALSIPFERL